MRKFASAALALAMCVAASGASWAEAPDRAPAKIWTERAVTKPLDPDAPVSMRAFSQLAKDLSPAVVNISVERKRAAFQGQGQGLGTGFIIHKSGYVLTNNHVVTEAGRIVVRLNNDHEYPATVVGIYAPLDVALLKVEPTEPLVAAPLGNSEVLEIGEWVIAIGNPFGLNHTVTAGIVSAKGRRDVTPDGEANHARFIQTDASINPGNSGGPLINIRGEVVGINTAINAAGQGIGFAVPIDMVKTVLPQLAQGHVARSYLGVQVGPVSRELAERLGLDRGRGALVGDVKPETPAAQAGVVRGDVIMSFDGRPIERWDDLPWLASTAGAKRPLKMVVNREGKPREVSVTLVPYPEPETSKVEGRSVEALGLTVTALAEERAKEMGLTTGQGVYVRDVRAGGAAQTIGLAAGDAIVQVNYELIEGGPSGFAKLVSGVAQGTPLALTVRRGERFMFKVFPR